MATFTKASSVELHTSDLNKTQSSGRLSASPGSLSIPETTIGITLSAVEANGNNTPNISVCSTPSAQFNGSTSQNTAVNASFKVRGNGAESGYNNGNMSQNPGSTNTMSSPKTMLDTQVNKVSDTPPTNATQSDLSSHIETDFNISSSSPVHVKSSASQMEAQPPASTGTVDLDTPMINSSEAMADGSLASDDDPLVGRRNLRKRKELTVAIDTVEEALKPLTDDERRAWKGWVELESDPAHFNYVLRQLGINDIKIQEIFSLDDEFLVYLPKPVYGLVFLFRYHDDDAEEQEDVEKCPQRVWFANQTTNNACATIALLNIVMNIPGLDLGDKLGAFKESTQDLKPPYRGKRIGNDEFIRNIHNSFARKMDVLNADLALKNEYDKWVKTKDNPPKKKATARKKAPPKKKQKDEDEPGFHYVAYVPVQGEVWRLDGLQREPVSLGSAGDNWFSVARDSVQERTLKYADDGVVFCLMALCKSPMRSAVEDLASNTHLLQAVETALADAIPDWKVIINSPLAAPLSELSTTCGLTQEFVTASAPSNSELADIEAAKSEPRTLFGIYQGLAEKQSRSLAAYQEEAMVVVQEDAIALRRKKDFTPVMYKAMKALADAGVLPSIIKDLRDKGKGNGKN
ncbi:uncharacterized protein L3040_003681 [Drepanopeziza brunnea f. sp. 'multigermtubi']|uniref:Ubiquitin carboxyl-terminal hydrolase n=1 Tax=Marssonina brunnea f. sp. multigermtubi (strain MB_m1) TaxID=1072389 RepID=K1WRV6_MARBU|nr:ubiquitin carboxyl-terminal hydrolase [Drepanopeziza brunnea f. sp. 'multigermtubi' MB_m1]EKD15117.1 ubiquitin carboxyl-terminal hydrolase [Drepanopeziza brunnea f. sp. 'multigermtubi' MB_m1]KAJ5046438.1 hypothetical protein L3040_003681 [Drepanopeziza brunnea f. sp. 'multigermtubi']